MDPGRPHQRGAADEGRGPTAGESGVKVLNINRKGIRWLNTLRVRVTRNVRSGEGVSEEDGEAASAEKGKGEDLGVYRGTKRRVMSKRELPKKRRSSWRKKKKEGENTM